MLLAQAKNRGLRHAQAAGHFPNGRSTSQGQIARGVNEFHRIMLEVAMISHLAELGFSLGTCCEHVKARILWNQPVVFVKMAESREA